MIFKIALSVILFELFMITILLVAQVYKVNSLGIFKKENTDEKNIQHLINHQLSETFSFVTTADSKFIGLLIFFFSNIFTGIANLLINTLNVSNQTAVIILCIYSFFSISIPFIFYKHFIINKK